MDKDVRDFIVGIVAEIVPKIGEYRKKQVNKYYREKELEYGGEYTKLEKYKNRVRVIDIFLPTLEQVLRDNGIGGMADFTGRNERDIP